MDSTEFDATLGGTEHLPHTANSFKFAASRSVEIAAMTESILRPSKTKLIFQTLPVHMRRRVMSHNCKRLPRRLREGHLDQLKKSGLPPKQKRPSRRYRRRPANLLQEYTRRQRRIAWLESHIWHAKRFHMVERWGYRLAHRPCDKAFRACYRATSAHCLLQDISYYTPIEIQGSIEDIEEMFRSITNKSCGLSITATAYKSGKRAGSVNIFKPNSYPYGFVGKIEFLWVTTEEQPKLIIFVHPSQIKDMELILSNVINDLDSTVKNPKRIKLNSDETRIKIQLMYGRFNRFRLIGPKSHAVLTHSLKCVTDLAKIELNEWVAEKIQSKFDLHLQDKSMYWLNISNASSPSQLPPKIIIGLIVKDPRWSRPNQRTKAKLLDSCNVSTEILLNMPEFASSSPIWDEKVSEKIKNNAVTNARFIEHVTKTQIVPGEVNEDDKTFQSLPIVLIQQPGSQASVSKKVGYGSGWDIIVPAGYGLPFWLTFVMFGARAGGLRETEHLTHESGQCYFPPDSDAGKEEEKRNEKCLSEQYFKRPPSKRVNYIKLGISNPFLSPWNILLKDWGDKVSEEYFILRDRLIIQKLQESISRQSYYNIPEIPNANTCLVAVYLQIEGKGTIKDNARICLPYKEDMTSVKVLCEPQHEDFNEKLRKQKRLEHRQSLKQLRRKQLKLKKKNKITTDKPNKIRNNEPSEYVKAMRELWVPKNVDSVRYLCQRETMGYISKGAFSFTEAKSCAVGYVTFVALKCLLENKLNKVLVRNITSRQYRKANLQIINNP